MAHEGEVTTALSAASDALATPELAWITRASLTTRAYWLGVHRALAAIAPGRRLDAELMQRFREAAEDRPGDDAFLTSPLGDLHRRLLAALAKASQVDMEEVRTLLDALREQVVAVQIARADAYHGMHATLREVGGLADQGLVRSLAPEVHEALLTMVRDLERPLRALVLAELHWPTRMGLDGGVSTSPA